MFGIKLNVEGWKDREEEERRRERGGWEGGRIALYLTGESWMEIKDLMEVQGSGNELAVNIYWVLILCQVLFENGHISLLPEFRYIPVLVSKHQG